MPRIARLPHESKLPPAHIFHAISIRLNLLLSDLRADRVTTRNQNPSLIATISGIPFTRGPLASLLANQFTAHRQIEHGHNQIQKNKSTIHLYNNSIFASESNFFCLRPNILNDLPQNQWR